MASIIDVLKQYIEGPQEGIPPANPFMLAVNPFETIKNLVSTPPPMARDEEVSRYGVSPTYLNRDAQRMGTYRPIEKSLAGVFGDTEMYGGAPDEWSYLRDPQWNMAPDDFEQFARYNKPKPPEARQPNYGRSTFGETTPTPTKPTTAPVRKPQTQATQAAPSTGYQDRANPPGIGEPEQEADTGPRYLPFDETEVEQPQQQNLNIEDLGLPKVGEEEDYISEMQRLMEEFRTGLENAPTCAVKQPESTGEAILGAVSDFGRNLMLANAGYDPMAFKLRREQERKAREQEMQDQHFKKIQWDFDSKSKIVEMKQKRYADQVAKRLGALEAWGNAYPEMRQHPAFLKALWEVYGGDMDKVNKLVDKFTGSDGKLTIGKQPWEIQEELKKRQRAEIYNVGRSTGMSHERALLASYNIDTGGMYDNSEKYWSNIKFNATDKLRANPNDAQAKKDYMMADRELTLIASAKGEEESKEMKRFHQTAQYIRDNYASLVKLYANEGGAAYVDRIYKAAVELALAGGRLPDPKADKEAKADVAGLFTGQKYNDARAIVLMPDSPEKAKLTAAYVKQYNEYPRQSVVLGNPEKPTDLVSDIDLQAILTYTQDPNSAQQLLFTVNQGLQKKREDEMKSSKEEQGIPYVPKEDDVDRLMYDVRAKAFRSSPDPRIRQIYKVVLGEAQKAGLRNEKMLTKIISDIYVAVAPYPDTKPENVVAYFNNYLAKEQAKEKALLEKRYITSEQIANMPQSPVPIGKSGTVSDYLLP